jgi:hypothetical protein
LRSGSEETCKIQSLVEKIDDWDGEGGISAAE